MSDFVDRLKQLSSAEEFLDFFGLPYEERVVHVNRLHILKRFYQYLQREGPSTNLSEVELFRVYRDLLARAYADFVVSTPVQEKVFKVFQDAQGKHIPVETLRDGITARRERNAA